MDCLKCTLVYFCKLPTEYRRPIADVNTLQHRGREDSISQNPQWGFALRTPQYSVPRLPNVDPPSEIEHIQHWCPCNSFFSKLRIQANMFGVIDIRAASSQRLRWLPAVSGIHLHWIIWQRNSGPSALNCQCTTAATWSNMARNCRLSPRTHDC